MIVAARARWFAAAAAALVAAAVFAPVLDAGFSPEDFGWLVVARQLDAPWPLLGGDVFFVYFYRPAGLLFWWLTAQLFGVNAIWHNAADLALHALNAALVALLAFRIAGARAAITAGLAFATLPCGVGTAMWMSDRFDPLALMFGLGALLAAEQTFTTRDGAWRVGALLFLALVSKEVAFAFTAVLFVRLSWRAWRRHERRIDLWTAVVAASAAALALRLAVGVEVDTSLPTDHVAAAVIDGTLAWWRRLPPALFGFAATPSFAYVLLGVVAAAALASITLAWHRGDRATLVLAALGIGLLCLPALLQWPVTRLAFASADDLVVNLRFYYLASAGVALLLGAAIAALDGVRLGTAAALAVALGLVWVVQAHRVATSWRDTFGASSPRWLALAKNLSTRDFPPGCRIALDAPDFDADFRLHADVIAKAAAPRGASLLGCAVTAGDPVPITIVDAAFCHAEAWPGLAIARANGRPLLAMLGNLCTLQFVPQPDDPQAIELRVATDGTIAP